MGECRLDNDLVTRHENTVNPFISSILHGVLFDVGIVALYPRMKMTRKTIVWFIDTAVSFCLLYDVSTYGNTYLKQLFFVRTNSSKKKKNLK